jgi:DNA-binding transcriptional ArsR family regulator
MCASRCGSAPRSLLQHELAEGTTASGIWTSWKGIASGEIVDMKKLDVVLRALANERRLGILEWLKEPRRHFPPQLDGDLVKDGVCGLLIARKLKITQPSASDHLNILADAGLIRAKRIKQWTFYQRDEKALRKAKEMLARL